MHATGNSSECWHFLWLCSCSFVLSSCGNYVACCSCSDVASSHIQSRNTIYENTHPKVRFAQFFVVNPKPTTPAFILLQYVAVVVVCRANRSQEVTAGDAKPYPCVCTRETCKVVSDAKSSRLFCHMLFLRTVQVKLY